MTHWSDFDHVLVNRDFDRCVAEVRAILHAARTTRGRQPWLPTFVDSLLGK
jgi:guanylate kinase